jgi:alkanesulfonate monooxygenase SsuD/methylene tetrahydromethanopterin reductase-like flavin-dependent oxidoreductase (luciferase family)
VRTVRSLRGRHSPREPYAQCATSPERSRLPTERRGTATPRLSVYPRPLQHPAPVWIAVGGAPESGASKLRGANFVGSPQQVVEKILFQHEIFKHDRFLIQFSVGSLPHASLMRSIELFGTEVAPAVRAELARRELALAVDE